MSQQKKEKWHIVKDIPVTVLLALTVYACGGIWWLSQVDNKIASIEAKVNAVSSHESRIAVLESNNDMARSDRLRMEVKIDRILERISK